MFQFICFDKIYIHIVFNFDKITLNISSEDCSVNLTNIAMSKVFEMTPQGVGKWKKEKRPIISLLEKYFTQTDLEEFLEYGTVEKLEFANLQDYGNRVAEFVKLLDQLRDFLYQDYINVTHTSYLKKNGNISEIEELDRSLDLHMHILENVDEIKKIENEGLLYLAIVFANNPLKKSNSCEDFTVDNLSKLILYNYDEFQRQQTNHQKSHHWIDSVLLGNFLDTFRKEYPQYPDYNQILFRMAKNDFLSLVKLCMKYQPNYLHVAIRFCVQFNLYKYMDLIDIDESFNQITDRVGGITSDSFDFEKFKNEIAQIRNHTNKN